MLQPGRPRCLRQRQQPAGAVVSWLTHPPPPSRSPRDAGIYAGLANYREARRSRLFNYPERPMPG